jgi:hypothetical protein
LGFGFGFGFGSSGWGFHLACVNVAVTVTKFDADMFDRVPITTCSTTCTAQLVTELGRHLRQSWQVGYGSARGGSRGASPTAPRAGCLFGTNLDKIWDESGAVNGLLRQLLRLPDTLEGLRGVLESIGDFPSGLQTRVTSCSHSATSCSHW